MRLIRYAADDGPQSGVLRDGTVHAVDLSTERLQPGLPFGPLDSIRLLAPLVPSKVLCVGRSYAAHIAEMRRPMPECIEESFTVRAPRLQAAAYLLDIERVRTCVPGVGDVREVGLNRYEATLRVQLGPIRSDFRGSLEIDPGQAPTRLMASGQGRDRQSGSVAQVEFAADLEETGPDVTTVRAKADVTIRGRLGQFSRGVIKRTATELIRDFASCVDASLRSGPAPRTAEDESTRSEPASLAHQPLRRPTIGRAVFRALAGTLVDVVHRTRRRGVALVRRVLGTGR